MRVSFEEMQSTFYEVLTRLGFPEKKARLCAKIFTDNSLHGVYSHGLNRFPTFVNYVKEGLINIGAEPVMVEQNGLIETWDGGRGAGMYNATHAMARAIDLARDKGIGCVLLKNTNHWMRGGTYGWQAADDGCIGICFSNTIANMPAWGGVDVRLGNNPLVIAVPREAGHLVLDMAMSQFSYGKLQEMHMNNRKLPVTGGYNGDGHLTNDPAEILASRRVIPIGFWKGSGLSLMLDVLLVALSGGQSTYRVTESGQETGITQLFLCLHRLDMHNALITEILDYNRSSKLETADRPILYPGEGALATRIKNLRDGIPVSQEIWKVVCNM